MILKNKYFLISSSFVVIQQLLLAASTFFIALAGKNIFNDDSKKTITYVSLFFLFALLSYLTSSLNSFYIVKLKNSLYYNYVTSLFYRFNDNQNFNNSKNKDKLVNWLSGEANATLEDISYFIIDTISLYLNIIFTFFVFFITLGFGLSLIIGSALLISIFIVSILNKKIDTLAKNSQDEKLEVNTYLAPHWDYLFNSSSSMQVKTDITISKKLEKFFKTTIAYSALEQIVAAIPILIVVPALIAFLVLNYSNGDTSELGVIIAVLPRTLQLLGNVHGLSLSNSRIIFMRSKYNHLLKFNLASIDLKSNITEEDILIYDNFEKKGMSLEELECLISTERKNGRITIRGKNGSGKSSLIKFIRQMEKNSILISPDTIFDSDLFQGSTGQTQIKKIEFFLNEDVRLILLDEWDANLDESNLLRLNEIINKKSKESLIVEIRHSNVI